MFKKILIPVDLAHKDQLPALIDAARHLSSDDPSVGFDFLYVDDSGIHEVGSPCIEPEMKKSRRQEARNKLLELTGSLIVNSLSYDCHVRRGTVHEKILEESKRLKCDMIIMMANKSGLSSYFIGSNAERVLRHSQCSVMVVKR